MSSLVTGLRVGVLVSVMAVALPGLALAQSSTVAKVTPKATPAAVAPQTTQKVALPPDAVVLSEEPIDRREEIRKMAEEYVRVQKSLMPELTATATADATPANAEDLYTSKAPPFQAESLPALANFAKMGGRLFYLGERSGLYSWFVVRDGQIQMVHVTGDAKTFIIGGVFSARGDNVTSPQIDQLMKGNKDVANLLNNAAQQQREIVAAGSMTGGAATVQGGTSVVPPDDSIEGKTVGSFLSSVPASPGERLLMDMKSSASAIAGKNEKVRLYMVVDPVCRHCKETWRELAPAVREGKLSVSLIPITMGDATSDDMRHAANLLRAKDPLDAWDRFVNGDSSALEGEPEEAQVRAIFSNRTIIDRWNILATPYLSYRAKDGRIKIVQGRPERIAVVLGDLVE